MSSVNAGASSPNGTSSAQGKTPSGRIERRREWWAKHREVRSKLRDRSTLAKKENFQMHKLELPKIDSSRGFRAPHVNHLAAAAKKSPPNNKTSPQQMKQKLINKPKTKPQKATSSNLKQLKSAKADKKLPTSSTKPATQQKAEKTVKSEDSKQDLLSEVVIKTKDIYDITAASPIPSNYVLYIGNLPPTVTREQLMDHFRKTGGVKSVRIPKDKATGQGRGFAYMEFKNRISHGIALRLHNTTLCGQRITVEFQPSDKQGSKGRDTVKKENGPGSTT